MLLPPVKDIEELKSVISHVPKRHRDDAIQEAWVAHLSGKCAIRAVNYYAKKEVNLEKRHIPIEDVTEKINGNDMADDDFD